MQIYFFHPVTFEYIGAGVAERDQLDRDRLLVPHGATAVAPPAVDEAEVARFGNGEWQIVPDLRGLVYWLDGERREITEIDQTVPANGSLAEPPKTLTGDDVNAERDRRVLEGKRFTPAGYGATVHVSGDTKTQTNLSNLSQAAFARISQGDLGHITRYRDESNVVHDLTPPQVFDLWSQGAGYVSDIYEASWAIKDDDGGIPENFEVDPRWPE